VANAHGGIEEGAPVGVEGGARRRCARTRAGRELLEGVVEAFGRRTWTVHHAPANTAEPDTLHGRPRSPVAERGCELTQRAMLQDPDRTLAPSEHDADLPCREAVHEAEHEHLATIR